MKEHKYLTDSDGEMGEGALLEAAGIEYTGSPVELTHGIHIYFSSDKQLVKPTGKSGEVKQKTDEEVNDYEVDSFRFKLESGKPVIQVVENKRLKGEIGDIDQWLEKIDTKVKNLLKLQADIQKHTQDSVIIKITNPKLKKELTGENKLRILKMFVKCNSIKFRFSRTELPAEFATKLNAKIAEIRKNNKDFRLTYQFGRDDAENDEAHFQTRTSKFPAKAKTQSIEQKFDPKNPEMSILQKQLDKLIERINNLQEDKYPNCPRITLSLHENNADKNLKSWIRTYNASTASVREGLLQGDRLTQRIKNTIEPFGYTAKFTYKIVFENGNIKEIQVKTKPSKDILTYKYQLKLAEIQQQLIQLASSSLSMPVTPLARRSSFSKPTSVTVSGSPDGIFSCSTEVPKPSINLEKLALRTT